MPRIVAQQHVRGPATLEDGSISRVVVASEGIDAADREVLDRVSEASLSDVDAVSELKPVRKSFFRLPSGRFAVGRTQFGPGGKDSVSYLAHHLVVDAPILEANGGHPFVVLDIAEWMTCSDRVPRGLQPVWIQGPADPNILLSVLEPRRQLLANLASAVVAPRDRPVALVGQESVGMDLLRVLYRVLPIDRRLELTFCSYFHGAHAERSRFSVVMVPRSSDLPTRGGYHRFDLGTGRLSPRPPETAYGRWLARELAAGHWERIDTFNRAVRAIRQEADRTPFDALKADRETFAAFWEVAGPESRQVISGSPRRIAWVLAEVASPRPIADALLSVPPETLLGRESPADDVVTALALLRKSASRRTWSRWWDRWKEAPVLAPFVARTRPWWRRFG